MWVWGQLEEEQDQTGGVFVQRLLIRLAVPIAAALTLLEAPPNPALRAHLLAVVRPRALG